MTVKSMTGFGRGKASGRGFLVEVEVSSVNRRQLDVHVSLPKSLATLESLTVREIGRSLSRGHITASIRVNAARAGSQRLNIGENEIAACVAALRRAAAKLGLADDLSAHSLVSLPSVVGAMHPEPDGAEAWPLIRRALLSALRGMTAMRRKEGEALAKALTDQLSNLRGRLDRIRKLAPGVTARYKKALVTRLSKAGVSIHGGPSELMKELAIFADRSDISEELVRLDSHLTQAERVIASSKPVGRVLDFLAQEMFREINTIGSKANDVAISRHVIALKTDTERFREQVQNVE